jgi:hypothetical protein
VLKFMSAALAMAGLSGCDAVPEGKFIPGVRASENIIPGLPNDYATTHVLDGYATGILVKHQMGRFGDVVAHPVLGGLHHRCARI